MRPETAKLLAEAYGAPQRPTVSAAPRKHPTAGDIAEGDRLLGSTVVRISVTGYGFRKRATYRRLRIELADGTVVYCASDNRPSTCR